MARTKKVKTQAYQLTEESINLVNKYKGESGFQSVSFWDAAEKLIKAGYEALAKKQLKK